MRRYSKVFTRIAVILIVAINLLYFTCGCSWGWNWRGPYHHAAIVSTPKKTVSVTEETYSLIEDRLYKHTNGQLEYIAINHYPHGNMSIRDIASNSETLFLVADGTIFSLENSDLKEIYHSSGIQSLIIDEGIIYYIRLKETVNDRCKFELCSYNLSLQENKMINEFFDIESYYDVTPKMITIGEKSLFMDRTQNLFWMDSLGEQNRVSKYGIRFVGGPLNMFDKLYFALEENVACLEIVEQGVRFQYMDKVYEYPIQANQLRLYPIVKLIENKVYFAVNDWLQKEDCERTDCICRYNASMLISFDLETKQFSLQKQIGERDIFIDFSKNEYIYYSKGAVYKNESVLTQLQELIPDISYKIVEGNPLPLYDLKIAYNREELNYLLDDNRIYLSNEYA